MTDVDAKKDEIEEVKKDYEGSENEGNNNEDQEAKIPENGSGDNNGSAKSPTESADEEKMDQECHQLCHHYMLGSLK